VTDSAAGRVSLSPITGDFCILYANSDGAGREDAMKKKLSCRAMGMNCGFEVQDDSEEEITKVIGDHLERVHKMPFTEALRRKAKDLIRFVET